MKKITFYCLLFISSLCFAQPANDICTNAILVGNGIVNGTTINATIDAPAGFCGTETGTAPDVWYYFTDASVTGSTVSINTCNGTAYDSKISVYKGNCGSFTCVTGNDDAICNGASSLQSSVSFNTDGSSTYYILVHGFTSETGNFQLNISGINPPVMDCPADITVENEPGECGATVIFADATATDAEDGPIAVTQTMGLPSGSMFPVGTTVVEFSATDTDGNTSRCQTEIVVEDTEIPTAICQNITIFLDETGVVTLTPAEIDNGSTDNCAIATRTINKTSFNCTNVGDNTVKLTITDVNGNMSSCNAIVTVSDMVAPVAVCQDITVQLDTNGSATITADQIDNGSADACGTVTLSVTPDTFDCSNAGENNVTLTVTDVNGNTSTCTAIVTVEDAILPTAVCQPFTVVLDADGMATITAADVDGGSADNCGITSSTIDIDTFDCSNVGDNDVVLTVTDAAGNSSSCTAVVTVEDNTAPTAICQPFTAQLGANGTVTITAADVDGGSFDNCDTATATIDIDTFDCSNVGENDVVLTVTDVNGNITTCTAVVTVEDTISPTVLCQNITVQLDATGSVTITAADVDGGSTDNCEIASTSISQDTFDCSNAGENTVTLTVTDVNGNTSTCTAIVTVEDAILPTAVCQPFTVVLDADGMATITAADVDGGSADNCGITSSTIDINTFDCSNVGDNDVVLTVTDAAGNSSSCTAVVTVEDNTAPTAICQPFTAQLGANGTVTITAADVDGGSFDNCDTVTATIDIDTFDCSNVGENDVVLTVTDANGNTSTCTAVVTVEDAAPMVICQNITVQLDPVTGTVTIDPSDIDNGSADACGTITYALDMDTFDCSHVGENTVTLTVTDTNGNSTSCTAIVTVEDITSPEMVCRDITLELGADGTASIVPADVIASNTDVCGIFTQAVDIENFDCSDIGTPVTVQVFSNDVNGNLATCFATVTVVDALAPVVTCPEDQTVDPGTSNLFYEVPDYFATGEATATDNCTAPVTTTTQDPAAGTLLSDGVYDITLTATDAFGNIGTCVFELTVESVLGITDNSLSQASVLLYPNPADEVIYFGNPKQLDLQEAIIYDITGRMVQTIDLKNMGVKKAVEIKNLASASYLVVIKTTTTQITKRLIKK